MRHRPGDRPRGTLTTSSAVSEANRHHLASGPRTWSLTTIQVMPASLPEDRSFQAAEVGAAGDVEAGDPDGDRGLPGRYGRRPTRRGERPHGARQRSRSGRTHPALDGLDHVRSVQPEVAQVSIRSRQKYSDRLAITLPVPDPLDKFGDDHLLLAPSQVRLTDVPSQPPMSVT